MQAVDLGNEVPGAVWIMVALVVERSVIVGSGRLEFVFWRGLGVGGDRLGRWFF